MSPKDPESTRFTYIMSLDDVRLFDIVTGGDRIEMHEERNEQHTGRLVTARVLEVKKIPVK